MLFHVDHTLQFGLTITHNKGQEFDLILQIRQPWPGERRGLSSSNSENHRCWAEEYQQLMSCKHPSIQTLHSHALSPALRAQARGTDTEGSRRKRAAAPPAVLHEPAPDPTGAAGTQGRLLPGAWDPLGTAGSGCLPYRRHTGRKGGGQGFSWR